jgi:hypothetical protein
VNTTAEKEILGKSLKYYKERRLTTWDELKEMIEKINEHTRNGFLPKELKTKLNINLTMP